MQVEQMTKYKMRLKTETNKEQLKTVKNTYSNRQREVKVRNLITNKGRFYRQWRAKEHLDRLSK
jgi:hypothetical protein